MLPSPGRALSESAGETVTSGSTVCSSAMGIGAGNARAMIGTSRVGVVAAEESVSWTLGAGKSAQQWASQMQRRGWTPGQIDEAISSGAQHAAENLVKKGNAAMRYVHPKTGRSIVVDKVTNEVIHVGGDGFKYP